MGEFGEKFRQAREKKEISLEDVANVTKISARMLRAIEEEKFDLLPGGFFNRGFIRTYAKHLGLEPEDAINDYLACLRQVQIDPNNGGWEPAEPRDPHLPLSTNAEAALPVKPAVKTQEPVQVEELPGLQLPRIDDMRPPKKQYLSRPYSGIPWIKLAAGLCVLSLAFFLWTRHSRNSRMAGAALSGSPSLSSTTVAAAPPPSPQSAPTSQSSTPPVTAAAPAPRPSAQSPQPAAAAPAATLPTATHASTAPAETSADQDAVKVEKKGDVTIRSFGAPAVKPAENLAPAALTLIVRANENSWISVSSDGQLVTHETLIAPAATSFHASREIVVRVGNAAGVSFLWNGEDVPTQGSEGEAKTFIFDAQGMRTSTPPQPAGQNQ